MDNKSMPIKLDDLMERLSPKDVQERINAQSGSNRAARRKAAASLKQKA